MTEEIISIAEYFKKKVAESIFHHIIEVSHTLLEKYSDRLNKEEAIRRTDEVMSNKKKTTSITEAISAAIEVDPVLNLKALIHLIKDTTTEVVHKDKASEKKKKENEKAKKSNEKEQEKSI